ncbi:hypothetical protein NQ176_g3714 [Zarea fungicola]|uniref:Uncharacterized protein n=1 Tax=Zarea fungicola TaxID=93591 RepID=A0ACC1NI68_9HYPO|nr:hypothetical protein NQ176_g3714 [Lecanicillium fungicola]
MLLSLIFLLAAAGDLIGTGVSGICVLGPTPVTKCANSDLTKANWDAFGIDNFLITMIRQFGTSDNFPKFLLSQLAPMGQTGNANFDCSNIQDPTNCQIKSVFNPNGGSCNFKGLSNTLCLDFSSPEAGYVAANYINMYNGLRSNFLAVRQAVDNLKSQNFISNLVDKLSPQKQPIGPAIFGLISDLVVDILPIGGEVKAASTFLKKLKVIAKATKKDAKKDGKDIISVLESNGDIDKQAAATKDTLTQQLEAVAVGTQKRMTELVAQIFGPNQDPTTPSDKDIASTVAFQNAYHGGFLDTVPQVADLQPQMEKQMKTWIASQIISILGYAMFIDTTPLEDPPIVPGDPNTGPGVTCKAEGGFTVIGGCALFRIGAVAGSGAVIDGAQKANDIFALNDLGINMNDVIANAKACPKGNTVDFEGFLELDNSDTLPACMFTFPVQNVKL